MPLYRSDLSGCLDEVACAEIMFAACRLQVYMDASRNDCVKFVPTLQI